MIAKFIVPRLAVLVLLSSACHDKGDANSGGSDEGSPDQVGSVCMSPDDCYPEIDHAMLQGEVLCLDRVRAGYCTHECGADADCCAVDGECMSEFPEVCSPFESTGQMMCFLSCEAEHVDASGAPDEQSYCHDQVSYDFMCRSSGGGSNNRKVCVPGDCGVGAACGATADCAAGYECFTDFDGGYCTTHGCASNADCPTDTLCVASGDDSFCMKSCTADGDCELCRSADHPAACRADVTFVEAGTMGSVCVAPQ
jgi:hypothetical protein